MPHSTLRRVADPNLLRQTAKMMNNAYDLKEDSDGTAQFASWTPIVGSAGTVMGLGHFMAAVSTLRIGNSRANPEPAPEPHYAILHPLQLANLAANIVPLTASSVGGAVGSAGVYGAQITPGRQSDDDILENGPFSLGTLFGVPVYADANIAVDASDDGSGAVFSKEGFIYVSEVEPMMEPDENDRSLRAVELNLWGSYVWGLYRSGAYGVEALFDCTMPTS